MPPVTEDRRRALEELRREVESCTRCGLAETRTRAVSGEGDPGAELMFVGEAPGYHEDQQGRPFVGAAGKLLDELLATIGLRREQVFIANVLKCRPPNNRDPRPEEISACQPYLWRQIELIEPLVICTLGNFATKLLSGDQAGITRVHGRPRTVVVAGREVYLYPIFHPAAALYTPAMLATLKEDVARLPELLAYARGEAPAAEPPRAGSVAAARAADDLFSAAAAPDEGGPPAGTARPAPSDAPGGADATVRPDPPPEPTAGPAQAEQLGLF